MVERALVVMLVLGVFAAGLATPVTAGMRIPETHEPLPQATMIAPAAAEAPEAPVQASEELDQPASPSPEDAEAAPLATPAETTGTAAVPASPADPLFIPGTRFPVIVAPADISPAAVSPAAVAPAAVALPIPLPTVNAPASGQPLPARDAAGTTLHRFQVRRSAK